MKLLHSLPPYNFCGSGQDGEKAFERARVAVLPVPFDSTATYGTGAREGPHAIISASRFLEPYDSELKFNAEKQVGFFTLNELEPARGDSKETVGRVKDVVGQVLEKKKFPLMLGGEHSITIGAVQAIAQHFHAKDASVLCFDAHADWWDEYEGSGYSHASVGARIADAGNSGGAKRVAATLRGEKIADITPSIANEKIGEVIVGVRSAGEQELANAGKAGVEIVFAHEFNDGGKGNGANLDKIIQKRILPKLKRDVYLSFDLDGLDPSIMPSVGTPEPNGLLWWQVTKIIREVAMARNIVGADVVELSPIPGLAAPDFLAAKLAYFIAASAFAKSMR
ncbi:agmatinase family protein [Candidatus Micrarchaeota archaeon]|nr:agmatinase family protein [Candidatus Micrarchaeota archaeon]